MGNPSDLVLAGLLRAVLQERRVRDRARRLRHDVDGRQRLPVHREDNIVARALDVAFEREEAVVQRRELRSVLR